MRLDLLEECRGAERIGISGHVRPDGDCVGACLGLRQYLAKCLPDAQVKVFLEQPAQIFSELAGFGEINSDFPEEAPFDVYFALDSTADRLGGAESYFRQARKTINIDHHVSNTGSGRINYIMPQVGSTCELLYDLMDQEQMDKDIAMALYTGIIHDTGVFQYSNTTPATMEKGARLISYGFDFPRLILETFYQRTYVQAQVLGRALMESIRFMEGRCIVNHLRNITGVECAIFMYQTGVLEYRVSMRSSEKVNVAEVAAYFGGGGHARAAGCTMMGTFHDCVNNLSLHIEKSMRKWEAEHDERDCDHS